MTAAKRRPVTPPPAPDDLSRDELRRLARAERRIASPDRAQSAAGQREVLDIERARAQRLEGLSLTARLAETQSLARARGEEVRAEKVRLVAPALDEHGARVVRDGEPVYRRETVARVRIASRGGLQLAYERGDLDGGRLKADRLYETGKAYRWAFEASTGLGTPQRNLASASARSPLRASAGPQDTVFAAGEMLRAFRAELTARQRVVLDQVCGLDATLRQAALALKADPRTVRKALVEALAAATESRRRGADAAP